MEAELSAQQILKAKYPDIDLRQGTGIRDLVIRPSATLLALVNKALVFYFQQNDINSVTDNTPQEYVDKMMSNWFLTRKVGIQAIINARMYFAKPKNVNFYSDITFSVDGKLKFSPLTSVTFAASQLTFDSGSNQYYVDVDLIAEKPGIEYNITTGSLLYFSNFDPYFLHAEINYLREGAQDVETNSEFIARAKNAISTRNNINVPSIATNLQDNFTNIPEVLTVGYGDAEMIRDQIKVLVPGVTDPVWVHDGGCADIFCRTPLSNSIVQLLSDSTGKILMTGSVYNLFRSQISGGSEEDTIPVLKNLPITSITSSGNLATVTCINHGLKTGDQITVIGATPTGYNIVSTATVTGIDTFTYPIVGPLTSPATGTLTVNVSMPYTVSNTHWVSATPTSITRSGTTATVTYPNHGLMVRERFKILGASQSAYNGTFKIDEIVNRDSFTFTVSGSPATPASGSLVLKFVDRQNEVGFSDRQSLTIDFGIANANKTASFNIAYHQNQDGIQTYLHDKSNRVICADLLSRGFNLTLLDIVITAYNGPVPDAVLANDVSIAYLAGLHPGEPFVMSDLLSKLYAANIKTIQTPLGITYTKYWNDLFDTTSGTILDVLTPDDSLNIFVVNSITTTNQVID